MIAPINPESIYNITVHSPPLDPRLLSDGKYSLFICPRKVKIVVDIKQSIPAVKWDGASAAEHHPMAEMSMQCSLKMNLVQSVLFPCFFATNNFSPGHPLMSGLSL